MQPQTEAPAIKCGQCGMLHPQLAPGVLCPMKKETSVTGEAIDLSSFLTSMNAIMVSNIKNRKIKDIKKLCGKVIVEVTKSIESYVEE